MNILDVSFLSISSIIRIGKSTVCNNFQQFYILDTLNCAIIFKKIGKNLNTFFTTILELAENDELAQPDPAVMIFDGLFPGNYE